MGTFKLQLKYDLDLATCAEIAQRVRNFSIPFANIIAEWAAGNARKFAAGEGAEIGGASGQDLRPASWTPLSDRYRQAKQRKGFSDWLMVRTGALMESLTSSGGFAQFIDAHRAVFGTPLDAEDADKAMYNSESRPTIFLSEPDRLMIRRELQNYISFGGNYKAFLWARAGRLAVLKHESAEMDMQFREAAA